VRIAVKQNVRAALARTRLGTKLPAKPRCRVVRPQARFETRSDFGRFSKRLPGKTPLSRSRLSELSEHLFARPTYRACPVIREILETSSARDFPFAVTSIGIIDITAIYCLALPHIFWFGHNYAPAAEPLSDLCRSGFSHRLMSV
jgi:hypothetical protein